MDARDTWMHGMTSKNAPSQDAFQHAAYLIDELDFEKVTKFAQICNKEIALAYIKDEESLRYYQNDMELLSEMFTTTLREPALIPVFQTIYWGWVGEVRATRAWKGWERRQQGGPGVTTKLTGAEGIQGMQYPPQQDEQTQNFFQQIFNRGKKKQEDFREG